MQRRISRGLAALVVFAAASGFAACTVDSGVDAEREAEGLMFGGDKDVRHGRDVWFKNTYGGGWFLTTFLAYGAPEGKRLKLGFDAMMNTPRAERFAKFGAINDPDCRAPYPGEATDPMHPNDVCPDPEASGVLGIRIEHDYNLATGVKDPAKPRQFGVTCAGCHAGFNPVNPPANPAEPKWGNIHPTIGNLRFKFGAVFGANLSATNPAEAPKKALFNSWNPGTVDTTTLFDDGVNNPGVVTAFFDVPHRPYFTNSSGTFHRGGQGGEDDVGGQTAGARVYSNIGMCYRECSLPAVMTNTPIDVAACKAKCKMWPSDDDLNDMVKFLETVKAPNNPMAKGDDDPLVAEGKAVFNSTCASCHSGKVQSNDVVLPLSTTAGAAGIETSNNEIATNNCRALTTNWDKGKIWEQFASSDLNNRGWKGYRVMPLNGMWATAPYLHHNGIGQITLGSISVEQENADFEASVNQLLTPPPLRSGQRVKVVMIGGTPVPINMLPTFSGGKSCDFDELRGHSFGTTLPADKKKALIEYLRTL